MKTALPYLTRHLPASLLALSLATTLNAQLTDGGTASGATNPVPAGATVRDVKILDINTAVQVSGTAIGFTVGRPDGSTPAPGTSESKPVLTIAAGSGIAISATLNNNGLLNTSGASAGVGGTPSTVLVALDTVINDGGQLTLARNTLARNTTINAGGCLLAGAIAATADGASVNTGGILQVGYGNGSGALAKNITLNGGLLHVMMQGSSASNNGRGYIDGVTITNGGQIWLGSNKSGAAQTYARNITITNGDLLVWDNVAGSDDLANITIAAAGNLRVFGKPEEFFNTTVAPTLPMSNGAIITNLTIDGGTIIMREVDTIPLTPINPGAKLNQSAPQTFTYAATKTLTIKDSYHGSGNIHMSADLAANTGDQVILIGAGAYDTSFTGKINIIATSSSEPTDSTHWAFVKMSPDIATGVPDLELTGTVWYQGPGGPTSMAMWLGGDDLANTGLGIGLGEPPAPPTPWYELAHNNAYAAALANWTTQLQALQTRMGELRMGATTGAWISMNAAKYTISAIEGPASTVRAYGWQGGLDQRFQFSKADIFAGLVASYTTATENLNAHGAGNSDHWSAGIYFTTLWDNGWYLDLVGKYQNQHQKTTLVTPLGTDRYFYNQTGSTLSLELGKTIETKRLVIEPHAQAAWINLRPVDYGPGPTPDIVTANPITGLASYSMAASNPIIARLGVKLTKNADMTQDTFALPYARLSLINMSNTKSRVTVTPIINDPANPPPPGGPHTWTTDTDGTSVEAAAGITARFNKTVSLYAEISARWGGKIETPVAGNIGLRFNY